MLVSGIVAAVLFTSASIRIDGGTDTKNIQTAPHAIVAAGPTLAPFQHVRFCLRFPQECGPNAAAPERVNLTVSLRDGINRLNRRVNAQIAPRQKEYGNNLTDAWALSPRAGDCNDYAVTKRHELVAMGVSPSAMRLAVVRTASGIGHLVLTVATTEGDLVLDNLTNAIKPWDTTDYQWLKIQSRENPRFWHEVAAPVQTASRRDKAAPTVTVAARRQTGI